MRPHANAYRKKNAKFNDKIHLSVVAMSPAITCEIIYNEHSNAREIPCYNNIVKNILWVLQKLVIRHKKQFMQAARMNFTRLYRSFAISATRF